MSAVIKKRLMALEEQSLKPATNIKTLCIKRDDGVLIEHKTGEVITDTDTRQLFILEFVRA
jgi:hypothetical protein